MSEVPTNKATGGCLCGAVSYEITGPLRSVVYCHCEQCRKTSGHFVAATACGTEELKLLNDAGLQWYRSSPEAQRGFCSTCGSSLFWQPEHGEYVAIMAGALDTPTGLSSREHIHTASASDYYSLTDGLPQFPEYHAALWEEGGV